MDIINPNQFRKIRRLEGMRNEEDIWNLEFVKKVERKVEAEKEKNITEYIDNFMIEEYELEELLFLIRDFASDLLDIYAQEFLNVLEQYKNSNTHLTERFIKFLKGKDWVLPKLTILNGEYAQNFIESNLEFFGYGEDVYDSNIFIVFQLPKPLAYYWWKDYIVYNKKLDKYEYLDSRVIEWGRFYNALMNVPWLVVEKYSLDYGLYFERLNEVGQHDPNSYYYIWQANFY